MEDTNIINTQSATGRSITANGRTYFPELIVSTARENGTIRVDTLDFQLRMMYHLRQERYDKPVEVPNLKIYVHAPLDTIIFSTYTEIFADKYFPEHKVNPGPASKLYTPIWDVLKRKIGQQ